MVIDAGCGVAFKSVSETIGAIAKITKSSHVSAPASMSVTKIWCERWTRPNRRLLAQPSAVVSNAPANRATNPTTEMRIVMHRR